MRFAYLLSVLVLVTAVDARAANDDPWAAEAAAAATPDAGAAPSTLEEQEAAALAPTSRPQATEPPGQPRRPAPAKVARPRQAVDEKHAETSAGSGEAATGLAIELGTSGFASGTLTGGLLVGAR